LQRVIRSNNVQLILLERKQVMKDNLKLDIFPHIFPQSFFQPLGV